MEKPWSSQIVDDIFDEQEGDLLEAFFPFEARFEDEEDLLSWAVKILLSPDVLYLQLFLITTLHRNSISSCSILSEFGFFLTTYTCGLLHEDVLH